MSNDISLSDQYFSLEEHRVSNVQSANVSCTIPMQVSKPATIDQEFSPVSIIQGLEKPEIDVEVINVDTFKFEDTLRL